MAKLEIREHTDPESNSTYRALFVDGELFDWLVEEEELAKAIIFSKNNLVRTQAIISDTIDFFLSCFSEFLGRPITLKQVITGIQTGEI